MDKRNRIVLSALLLIFFSCAAFQVAEYNETIAGGASGLQNKVEVFLINLQRTAGTPEGEYGRHAGFYEDVRGDIDALKTAAGTARGNELTIESLDLIRQNVDRLEKMHAEGITPAEVGVATRLLDTQLRMLVELQNDKKRKET